MKNRGYSQKEFAIREILDTKKWSDNIVSYEKETYIVW
jgi:hypothetical protein